MLHTEKILKQFRHVFFFFIIISCFYIRQYILHLFSTGICSGACGSFLLFSVPERGRRQDGECRGKNYKPNPFIIQAIRISEHI